VDINNPIPQEWSSYVTQTNLGLETIPAMLYSTKDYVSGVTRELTFFDTVQSSRQDLTNMQQPNMLPNPESFLIQCIRSLFKKKVQSDDSGIGDSSELVSGFDDVVNLCQNGVLNFKIGNKQYGPWPLDTIAAGNFPQGAFSTGSDLLADYAQIGGPMYSLFPNLMIAPLQQFTVVLTWPGGPITLSTGSESTCPIRLTFDGQLARSIQ